MAHNNKGYGIKSEMEDPDWMPEGAAPMKAGRKGKGAKAKAVDDDCGKAAPGVEEGINVTTKFPVARIKRIMQADEDIGKVAQVTPTAVCMFLLSSLFFFFFKGLVIFLRLWFFFPQGVFADTLLKI